MKDNKKRRKNGSVEKDVTLEKPGEMDFERANEAIKRVIHENQEWLKEMANR